MHSIVTTFREAVIKVEVANFGAAIDTLIDQDDVCCAITLPCTVGQGFARNITDFIVLGRNAHIRQYQWQRLQQHQFMAL